MRNPLNNIVWSPVEYSEAAALAQEAGKELLSRLEWFSIQPRIILDVGGGCGNFSQRLQERYPLAQVVLVDHAPEMINYAKNQYPQLSFIHADAASLPFPSHSVDLIFAHFLLPWQQDSHSLLQEWQRVLRADGVLLFTALGPDTLQEWQDKIPEASHLFYHDLHDLGDQVLQVGLSDPVLDINFYTLRYRQWERLCFELEKSGMGKPYSSAPSLSSLQTTYEVIYGHAFGKEKKFLSSSPAETSISLAQMRSQLQENKKLGEKEID